MDTEIDYGLENRLIEPKEQTQSAEVEIETLLPSELLQDGLPDDDDDCVICYLTLYRPVRTECGHSACEPSAMDIMTDHSTLPSNLAVDGIKFKCPTCRTYTQATFDTERSELLKSRHPEDYASRAAEVDDIEASSDDGFGTQTMLIMFGNSHRKLTWTADSSLAATSAEKDTHEWTFFVQSSRQDLVEKVDVILHPTYRENRLVTLSHPPFATTHQGRSYFTIYAGIQLREGWQWVDEAMAVDSDARKHRYKDRLPIEWALDLHENGQQTNRLVKFRKIQPEKGKMMDNPVVDVEEEEELDLRTLAGIMSETEIEQLRHTRRFKRRAS
ncbi:hypothetical protein LTR05_005820 [Lithohypha guttulata]|uniref:RING-type domain-containing protein n=1 Tax=Lithohypha guttulata TaxID=1690604 RepID=A0AAN7SZQ3_9EURO|nr:hypothetical protein LTR05_005820 [Lithohypha guttulata]